MQNTLFVQLREIGVDAFTAKTLSERHPEKAKELIRIRKEQLENKSNKNHNKAMKKQEKVTTTSKVVAKETKNVSKSSAKKSEPSRAKVYEDFKAMVETTLKGAKTADELAELYKLVAATYLNEKQRFPEAKDMPKFEEPEPKPKAKKVAAKKPEAKKVAKESKVTEKAEYVANKFGEIYAGVAQIMKVTAKVRKEIEITQYSDRCWTLKCPKSLHDLIKKELGLSWSTTMEHYWLPKSKLEKATKLFGVKVA